MVETASRFGDGKEPLTLGIVGAGIMGRGIAQIAAEAGLTVLIADAKPEAAEEARTFVGGMLDRKRAKGRLSEADAAAALSRIRVVPIAGPGGYEAMRGCDAVVEAVVERIEVKRAVLAGLEAVVEPSCILASNTSSLSVTELGADARRPERVAGFHFFNPVPLMRVVEVVAGARTEAFAVEALEALAKRMGHRPVRASDSPGFLVNHAGRAYTSEAMRIVGEGVCAFGDVDRVMVEAAGFGMGPFQLIDLVGMDVVQTVSESVYHQYFEEPRYRPVHMGALRRSAGLLGRKSGAGFYRYGDGKPVAPAEAEPPAVAPNNRPVWVSGRYEAEAKELRGALAQAGAALEDSERPSAAALCLVTPFGLDASMAALEEGLDPQRTVAVDMLLPLGGRRTIMAGVATLPEIRDLAHALLAAGEHPVTVIHDSPGFLAQRVIASIVNLGCDIAQQRIAAPADIDVGVKLALGYPKGPLEWGDALGPRRILAILEAMHDFYGDPRYRPSPWLKRRALLDLPLATPEN
ncbi:3-hydroxyacyl-CoA dehydrogenase [Aurantimonas sp. VKM B-3413]|uniref:3-hydroxyacyl-CoA dehydrogenase n=1 Tax=Aurantimonas sp. VKM B-3413 TaxID=2779401 RepID=UPI001E2D7A25|nr:3-hydroxyacyl-CoA dehydrogenase [Aurantimonas sp. VKM B-3413]MCB8840290.1 3-hydroxyacyl-CoA dehydrogenase [Aurantimonas sp. VKM B-3413]